MSLVPAITVMAAGAAGWLTAAGIALLAMLLQAAVVGVGLALLLKGLQASTPKTRYAWSCLALASLPVWFVATLFAAHASLGSSWQAPLAVAFGGRLSGWLPAVSAPRLLPLLTLIWAAGVAGMAVYSAGGWVWVRRMQRQARLASGRAVPEAWQRMLADVRLRMGVAARPLVSLTAAVASPCVVGCWRPVILLPLSALSAIPAEQIEALLAHELAHVLRRDYLVNLGQRAIETMFFYHPAVWWISRQVEHEREECCDDLAMEVCGDRLGYARALVEFAAAIAQAPASRSWACAAGGGSLRRRVGRILGAPRRPPARHTGLRLWGVLGCVLALAGLSLAGMKVMKVAAKAAVTQRASLPAAVDTLRVGPRSLPNLEKISARAPALPTAAAMEGKPAAPAAAGHPPGAEREASKAAVRVLPSYTLPAFARSESSPAAVVAFSFAAVESCSSRLELVRHVAPSGWVWLTVQPRMTCAPEFRPAEVWVITT